MSKTYSIKDLKKDFRTDKKCLDYIYKAKYKDLNHCLKCGFISKHWNVKGTKRYVAKCGHTLFPCKDTIFENSSTLLSSWFHAIFLFSISKNGVSAKELGRSLGITYKTAWRIAKQIRSIMDDDGNVMFKKTNEIDETYIGGCETNKHELVKNNELSHFKQKASITSVKNKKLVQVKFEIFNQVNDKTISAFLETNISKDSTIIIDEWNGYKRALQNAADWFTRKVVNHSNIKYENIKVSTNGIEGMWSCLKRGLKGTYIKVSKKHLPFYLNEFESRQNHKNDILKK
ncbi:IS1595 family transposase [Mycoplasma phocoeninasale]|uniref:IS1595 family transposase n=1 Tax=Mycoplasma phocoeninasale TaxID=2726117 RepID=UPI0019679950|nr:IS1595 family transposase [Mycoplasma phocoeninasale]MBN0970978.1 IS1595 family transposase [Mycoplasma phocoeninasale]